MYLYDYYKQELMLTKESTVTGVQVNYYFICITKLWYFSHYTTMEHTSDAVALGRLVHEKSYKDMGGLAIDRIRIDFIEKGDKIILHEVKKSKKMERSHIFQLLYYLYDLKLKGIPAEGVINYPLLRRTESLQLTSENQRELETVLEAIREIVGLKNPPKPEKKNYCRKCSYFEFCWVI
jgi:CRISPR-associated exonuclease Cas4